MAPGRKSLRRLQIGKETTPGTSAAATVRLRFADATIEDALEIQELEEQVGIIGGVDRTALVKSQGKISVGEQPITFEQLPYILAMALGGPVVGTTGSSTSSERVFLTNIATTTTATITTFCFEGGDDHEVEKMTYGYVTKFTLGGKGGDVLKLSADIEGRGPTTAAGFTTSAVLPNTEDIVFSKGKVYLDTITGSYGATQVSNQVISANVEFDSNIMPKWTADGSLDFSFATYIDQNVSGSITFEHDTAADGGSGAKYDMRQQTPKLLRLLWEGSALTSAGNYSKKSVIVDLPVKWITVGKIEEDGGNDLITANFRSRYSVLNSTAGNGKVIVVLAQSQTTGTGQLSLY